MRQIAPCPGLRVLHLRGGSAPLPSAVSLGGSPSGRVGIPLLASPSFSLLPSPFFFLPSSPPPLVSPSLLPHLSLRSAVQTHRPGQGRPSCRSSGKVRSYSGDDAGAGLLRWPQAASSSPTGAAAHGNCPVVKAKGKCQLQPWDPGAISAVPFPEGPWASVLLSSGPQFPPLSARQEILQPSSQGNPDGHRTVLKMFVLIVALALGQHRSLRPESQLLPTM